MFGEEDSVYFREEISIFGFMRKLCFVVRRRTVFKEEIVMFLREKTSFYEKTIKRML